MKLRTVLIAACMALMVAVSACTSTTGHDFPAAGQLDSRRGAVITVGSFDFPKVSCSPRSTARRSPRQGSRYGSCRTWAPASWSIRR
jgi:hypothetical protein